MRTTTNISTNFPAARYTFASKERDEESGLSYFGARYYSSDLSIWLSVDPMSDKYPSLSPYVYCANNPIKLVDPNGEEISGPDGWVTNNSKKTLTWVNNKGGDMCQYINGNLESFMSKEDFVNEYAEKGYDINTDNDTKSLVNASVDSYSGFQKGWNVLSKQQEQKISYNLSKSLKNNGFQIQTRQLKIGINKVTSPNIVRGANALSVTLDIADFAYNYSVLDNGKFGANSCSSLGSSTGSWGGSIAGCKFGVSVGACFGPYGSVVGGVLGGITGGFLGSKIGSKIGLEVYDFFKE